MAGKTRVEKAKDYQNEFERLAREAKGAWARLKEAINNWTAEEKSERIPLREKIVQEAFEHLKKVETETRAAYLKYVRY